MAEAISKPRQLAEVAFGKIQSQFIAKQRAFEEQDSIKLARDEKTLRLRAARLEQAHQDNTLVISPQKRAKSDRRASSSIHPAKI